MRVCLYVLCGHLLGKGWPPGSRLWFLAVSLSLSHWYPGSGVVLDCIDSLSLHPYLLCCLLLLPLLESVIVLCFVVRYFMSILVLQSSLRGREIRLLCLVCLPGVFWLLCCSSSWCWGFVCSLCLRYFLIKLTFFKATHMPKWVFMC